MVIGGIPTDGAVTFACLSAMAAGYNVYVVLDASGTFSEFEFELALARLTANGVNIMTWFAVGTELLGDWSDSMASQF